MMGSTSSWTFLAVERREAAVTTLRMIASLGSTAPGFAVPAWLAEHPECHASTADATPYLPLCSALAPYLMLPGGS